MTTNQKKIEPATQLDRVKVIAIFIIGILGLCLFGFMYKD